MTECAFTVTAEETYTILLRDGAPVEPGWAGSVTATAEAGHSWRLGVTVKANAVWRRGRVFLVCPRCGERSTRLYAPRPDSWLACRRCWGLTYESRQRANYKDSGPSDGENDLLVAESHPTLADAIERASVLRASLTAHGLPPESEID